MDSSSSESDWSSDGEGQLAPESSVNAGGEAGSGCAVGVSTSLPLRGPMEGRPRGTLRLDKTEARSGEKVGVYWNVPSVLPDARDWIGIYETGEQNIENYLGFRLRGESRERHGHIEWPLVYSRCSERSRVDVFFCMFRHNNSFLARSTPLSIVNPLATPLSDRTAERRPVVHVDHPIPITVSGLGCTGLRTKLFGHPDPYLKLQVSPQPRGARLTHHGQRVTTEPCHDSIHPCWLVTHTFEVLPMDILEVEVRDKFTTSRPSFSHFLGKVKVPLYQFLRHRGTTSLTFTLQKRLPSDRVSGTLSMTVTNNSVGEEGEEEGGGGEGEGVVQVRVVEEREGARAENVAEVMEGGGRVEEGGEGEGRVEEERRTDTTSEVEASSSDQVATSNESPLPTSGSQAAARQPNGDVPSIIVGAAAAEASFPMRKQLSDDPQTNSELTRIRQTLCGGRPLRRGSRSLYLPGAARQRSHDLTTSLSPFPPALEVVPSTAAELTESLPPNWELRMNDTGCPLYYDHQNKMVSLDRPGEQTVPTFPPERLRSFIRRSDRNLFSRQASLPSPSTSSQTLSPSSQTNRELCHTATPVPKSVHTLESIEETSGREGGERWEESEEGGERGERGGKEIGEREGKKEEEVIGEEGRGSRGEEEEKEEGEAVIVSRVVSESASAEFSEARDEMTGQNVTSGEKVTNASDDVTEISDERVTLEEPSSIMLTRVPSLDEELRSSPAFKFLTRPDLYKFAKEERNDMFFGDMAVLELIQNIRSDHTQFARYQHNSRLVRLLNSFARTDAELPSRWERKKDPRSGRVVFVDHNSQRTTYIDPRLPYPGNNLVGPEQASIGVVARSRPFLTPGQPQRSPSSAPSPPPPPVPPRPPFTFSSPSPPPPAVFPSASGTQTDFHQPPPSPQGYSERVVAFLRQPQIFDELRSRYEGEITAELRSAIETIRLEGAPALERMQSEMDNLYFDLTIMLSLFEEEIAHNIFPVETNQPPPPPPPPLPLPPPSQPIYSRDFPPPPPPIRPSCLPTPPPPPPPPPLPPSTLLPPPPPPPPPPPQPIYSRDFPPPPPPIRPSCLPTPPPPPPPPLPHPPYSQTSPPPPPPLLPSCLPPPPPPPPPPPLPPSLHTPHHRAQRRSSLPDVDPISHMFAGIPLHQITEFMQQNRAYHSCLSRFGSVSSEHRQFFAVFSENPSLENVLTQMSGQRPLREFIYRLAPDIRSYIRSLQEAAGSDDSDTDSDDSLTGLSQFPTVEQVKAFFSQPNIFSILPAVSSDDRQHVQTINNLPNEILEERLFWDNNLREFIRGLSSQISTYSAARSRRSFPSSPTSTSPPTSSSPTSTLSSPSSLRRFTVPSSDPSTLPPYAAGAEGTAFITKLQELQRNLERNGYCSHGVSVHEVRIRREHILEDSFRFVMGTSAKHLRKRRLNISWDREEGLDYGGPQREFFFKLSRLLFNPYYGLFEYSAQGSYTLQISPQSAQIGDAHKWFRFAGRLIGYAIIQEHLLDVFFARHVYKALLGRPYTVQDVEALDISFYNSLVYVLENDPEPLELNFTVLEENFGEMTEKELKPKGSHTNVTNGNKKEYVDLMVQWRLSRRIGEQADSFRKGLQEMLPLEYLHHFDSQELEWVIAGTAEINMADWKNNTAYWGGYHSNHRVILWFWEVVEAYTTEQKLKLLQFVTGTSSIPFEGFRALRGSNSIQPFTIDSLDYHGTRLPLPIAHTCFNRLDMPRYNSKSDLQQKLTLAIEECESFENA